MKGSVFNLSKRAGAKVTFYAGQFEDATGKCGITFFRDDITDVEGKMLKIQANEKGGGFLRTNYQGRPTLTVYGDAEVERLTRDEPREPPDPPSGAPGPRVNFLESPGQAIGNANNCASIMMAALIRTDPEKAERPLAYAMTPEFELHYKRLFDVALSTSRDCLLYTSPSPRDS